MPAVATADAMTARAHAVERVLRAAAQRRDRGEAVDEEALLNTHQHLMPELAEELRAAREIRTARLAAERVGPVAGGPLAILPNDELDGPLDVFEVVARGEAVEGSELGIDGYALVREVGGGGQACVYEAVQERTHRRVAVKVLPGGPFANSRRRARFGREADVLATIEHPNIVDVIDRGRTRDGSFFFVMRFVDGPPLDEYVMMLRAKTAADSAGGEDPRPLLRLFAKVAVAAGDAHRLGIIHRDLKPSNIRIDRHGEPHLLDFGLARRIGPKGPLSHDPSVTRSGQILGSLPWASPEQASGGSSRVDARSDVYAIGVMLYQALTGAYPYRVVGRINDVLHDIQHAAPVPPGRRHRNWVGVDAAAIDAVVMAALAKEPSRRYPDAAALAADLDNCIAGRVTERVAPQTAGNRRLPTARLATAAIIAAAAITIGVLLKGPQPMVSEPESGEVLVADLPAFGNSVGMRMRLVPAGKFNMGTTPSAMEYQGTERLHEVDIVRPFYLATTEVTRGQYRAVMGERAGAAAGVSSPENDLLPVTGVTWEDAIEFCRRLGQLEGGSYRLPSETEWEYACRAGSGQIYGGSGLGSELGVSAWYATNSNGSVAPVIVSTRRSNIWGFRDLMGNAREWCADAWTARYEPDKAASDETRRVVKGGSVLSDALDCRPAARTPVEKGAAATDLGFRVACDAEPAFR